MKPRILFPTDFSDYAHHALDYAIALAAIMKAGILVFHSSAISYIYTDMPADKIASEMEADRQEAEKKLQKTLAYIRDKNSAIPCSYHFSHGLPSSQIIETAREKNVDMIVMGTQGAGAVEAFLFGSNTAKVIEKARCPVFAIPIDTAFKEIKEIVYASDFYDSDLSDLNNLSIIARGLDAEISIVNVSDEGKHIQQAVSDLFIRDLRKEVSYPHISIHLIEHSDVLKGLEQYFTKNKVDMLVMSTRKRNFLEKLIDRSLTKQMAYHARLPLLAFHHEDI